MLFFINKYTDILKLSFECLVEFSKKNYNIENYLLNSSFVLIFLKSYNTTPELNPLINSSGIPYSWINTIWELPALEHPVLL